jgi:3-hydroxyacyl-[acyl-carrier-protein] dehydratase
MLEKDQVLGIIPHRPPFLWIDRVEKLEPGVSCVATKFVDPNEPIFAGHFPGNAILPGALIIESAAQTAAVMMGSLPNPAKSPATENHGSETHLLASVNRFKFLLPVRPGVELRIETRKIAELGTMASVEAKVWVGNQEVAKGELIVLTVDRSSQETGAGGTY